MTAGIRRISLQYDHRKIPIIGLVAETSNGAPASPGNGQIYYDTSNGRFYGREGGAWVLLSQTGALLTADRGATNGVASLVSGKVPIAQLPTGSDANSVTIGNDSRLSNTRTPTDGSVTGGPAGAGVKIAALTITHDNIAASTLTLAKFNASAADQAAGTASLRSLGTGATQAAAGNDSRLSDTRTPTDSSVTLAKLAASMIDAAAGTASARTLAFTATAAMPGNARLDQVAVPTASVSMNSQKITSLLAGTSPTDAVNLAQAQALAAGIKGVKNPVRVAVSTNVNLASPGASLDGVAMSAGDRFLAYGQTTGTQNGIYVWNGAAAAATRASDADEAGEVVDGTVVVVAEGANAAKQMMQTATESGAPGAWTQVWQISNVSGTTYLAGNGLTLTGSTFAAQKDTTDATNPITVTSDGIGLGTVPVDHGGTGATTAAAARTNLGTIGKYSQDLGALTAGVELIVTHNLNSTDLVGVTFKEVSSGELVDMGVRVASANTIGVTSMEAWAASAVRVTVGA